MPYIRSQEREDLKRSPAVQTPGQLNFMLTLFIKDYIDRKGLSYQTINDIVGALEGTKLEFYRRIAVPYENTKMAENGDVY